MYKILNATKIVFTMSYYKKTMKKLLPFVFLLTSTVLCGQDLSVGIKGGALFSSVHKTDPQKGINMNKDAHLTSTIGVNAELRLFNDFFGVLEANYEKKGFSEHYFSTFSSASPTPPESLFRVDNQSSFNYLSFPILMRYKYGQKIKAFGSVGVSPAIFVSADELNSRYPLTYNTKKLDISGIIEAGLEWELLSHLSLYFGARYDRSFTHHNKHLRPDDGGDLRHIANSFYGGIKYYIK